MNITLEYVFGAMVAVPCIVALAKATDNSARVIAALGLLSAVGAIVAPVFLPQAMGLDAGKIGQIGWVSCGVMSIIAGVRIADGVLTTLIISGGTLGALLHLGVIAR